MKLEDFKGKSGSKAMAELLRLVSDVSERDDVKQFVESLQGKSGAEVLSSPREIAPLFEDDAILDKAVSIIAKVKKLDEEDVAENGNIVWEFFELLTYDFGAVRFLSGTQTTQE